MYLKEYPKDFKEFDSIKNDIKPDNIEVNSSQEYWWTCKNNHSYKMKINDKVFRHECPYCQNRKIWVGFNDLYSIMPSLAKEFDEDKNGVSTKEVYYRSTKKYYWKCDKGHSYLKAPYYRVEEKQNCPYCSKNYLIEDFPKSIDYIDNNYHSKEEIENFYSHSTKKIHFHCRKGHKWEEKIANFSKRSSIRGEHCPYCSNIWLLKGFNDIKTLYPQLYKEIKNKDKDNILPTSKRKITWVCPQGHEFNSSINYRVRNNSGCPYCTGVKVLSGFNDLKTLRPDLMKYWDYQKNELDPTKVSRGTTKKAWWKCDKGHSHLMPISKKTIRGSGCPYCSGRRILPGYNDIATTYPEILKEWNYDKNTITPQEIMKSSGKKVWWICEKGHEWKISPNQRTYSSNSLKHGYKKGTNCPYCALNITISRGEQEVYDYVKSILPENTTIIQSDRSILHPKELDIYIPDYNIAIEYNGAYWHKESELRDKYYHYNKWKECNDNNINLITVWDYQWNNDNAKTIIKNILQQKLTTMQDSIIDNIQVVKITKNQAKKFCNSYHLKGFSDGDYFNGVKNKDTGKLIAVGVWNHNDNILYLEKYCSHTVRNNELKLLLDDILQFNSDIRKVVAFSDLENSDNEMLKELGFQQECLIDPEYGFLYKKKLLNEKDFTIKLFKKDKELEYQEGLSIVELLELNDIPQVYNSGSFKYIYTISDTCLSQKDVVDKDTKEIVDEDKKFELNILNKWDYKKNDSDPTKIKRGSHKVFWFLCDKGHSYHKEFRQQYKNGKCVYCSNVKVLAGFNDIATTHSKLVREWNYDKNDCSPQEFTFGSSKKVWWKCDYGHEWEETINQRTSPKRNYNCPYCSNHRTIDIKGKNNINYSKYNTIVSHGEKEVFEYIKSILPENTTILNNDKTVLKTQELDIYIPDYNIAIEYNGAYWHKESELRDKYYHYNKWKKCNDNGIQLITIWDVNWYKEDKKNIIKKLLCHKLGVSTQQKIFARKTIVSTISNHKAREFCSINHIQGFSNGSYYSGLKDKTTGELVAVGIWRKNKDTLYLDRYCTDRIVVGGMGKLLKDGINYAKNNGLKEIVTFADLEVSDGSLYDKLGFIRDKILAPDYKYLYDDELKHKFGFRLNRFRNDPLLEYKDGLTEWELAELNDIPRIYDSGKIRYKISV